VVVEVEVGLPLLAWVVEVLSWPSVVVEVEVGLPLLAWVVEVLSWPSVVVEVEVEVVGSSPWLTPHANTESL
jgi:hypothetical protein